MRRRRVDALVDRRAHANGHVSADGHCSEGDEITIDGTTGDVDLGGLAADPPPSELPDWLEEFLSWADEAKRLGVWANADTPEDARQARANWARPGSVCAAPSTCSWRRERLPVDAANDPGEHAEARDEALDEAARVPARRFQGILQAMAGYTVTIRLLDPPLHEFLPSLEELLVETTELRLREGERLARLSRKMKRT